jgi:hypothetical protein
MTVTMDFAIILICLGWFYSVLSSFVAAAIKIETHTKR